MRYVQIILFLILLALVMSQLAFASEEANYCESGSCGHQQQGDRVNLRYKYRTCYPVGCYPYYYREYGVDREASWATKIYEPFHQQLAR